MTVASWLSLRASIGGGISRGLCRVMGLVFAAAVNSNAANLVPLLQERPLALRRLSNIRRDPPRLIARERFGY
jgi:hypothetical protein